MTTAAPASVSSAITGGVDTITVVLSAVALLATVGALIFAFLVSKAAELPSWVQ